MKPQLSISATLRTMLISAIVAVAAMPARGESIVDRIHAVEHLQARGRPWAALAAANQLVLDTPQGPQLQMLSGAAQVVVDRLYPSIGKSQATPREIVEELQPLADRLATLEHTVTPIPNSPPPEAQQLYLDALAAATRQPNAVRAWLIVSRLALRFDRRLEGRYAALRLAELGVSSSQSGATLSTMAALEVHGLLDPTLFATDPGSPGAKLAQRIRDAGAQVCAGHATDAWHAVAAILDGLPPESRLAALRLRTEIERAQWPLNVSSPELDRANQAWWAATAAAGVDRSARLRDFISATQGIDLPGVAAARAAAMLESGDRDQASAMIGQLARRTDLGDYVIQVRQLQALTAAAAGPAAPALDAASDHDFTTSIGLTFVQIAAGQFTRGSPLGEPGRRADEPQALVRISRPFFLSATEVTQRQWRAVMDNNPAAAVGDERPIEHLSWVDAQQFCQRLSQKTHLSCRLPTEAEWEYACRAGTTTAFSCGAVLDPTAFDFNETNPLPIRPREVGLGRSNGAALFDMHGNVSEWCADFYGPYAAGDNIDPTGPTQGSTRVVRGGAFSSGPAACRSAARYQADPASKNLAIGFRVAANPN